MPLFFILNMGSEYKGILAWDSLSMLDFREVDTRGIRELLVGKASCLSIGLAFITRGGIGP